MLLKSQTIVKTRCRILKFVPYFFHLYSVFHTIQIYVEKYFKENKYLSYANNVYATVGKELDRGQKLTQLLTVSFLKGHSMVTYVIAHHFLDSIHAFHDQIIVINAKHFERAKLIRRDQMSQLACLFIFLYRGVQTCSSFIHGSVAKIRKLHIQQESSRFNS